MNDRELAIAGWFAASQWMNDQFRHVTVQDVMDGLAIRHEEFELGPEWLVRGVRTKITADKTMPNH